MSLLQNDISGGFNWLAEETFVKSCYLEVTASEEEIRAHVISNIDEIKQALFERWDIDSKYVTPVAVTVYLDQWRGFDPKWAIPE